MNLLEQRNVQVVGQGEPTLVLAHGFGTDQTAWRPQIEALAPEHRIVAFDHLGSSRSDAGDYSPEELEHYERFSQDIVAILDTLGVTASIFVGHSASGMIGLLASLARPELFAGLVLLGASPRYLDDVGYRGGFTRDDVEVLYRSIADDYFAWATGFARAAMGNPDRPALGEELARQLSSMRPDIAQSVARAIFESDHRGILDEVRVPVLILQSNDDLAVPVEVGRFMAARIPESQLVVLDTHGHLPHVSSPDLVTAAIRTFVAEIARRSPKLAT